MSVLSSSCALLQQQQERSSTAAAAPGMSPPRRLNSCMSSRVSVVMWNPDPGVEKRIWRNHLQLSLPFPSLQSRELNLAKEPGEFWLAAALKCQVALLDPGSAQELTVCPILTNQVIHGPWWGVSYSLDLKSALSIIDLTYRHIYMQGPPSGISLFPRHHRIVSKLLKNKPCKFQNWCHDFFLASLMMTMSKADWASPDTVPLKTKNCSVKNKK